MLQKALEGFGSLWEGFGRLCNSLGCFGRFWEALAVIVKICKRLWMVWKALEALGILSEALGSFEVNTVCPLPGSWINHVANVPKSNLRFDLGTLAKHVSLLMCCLQR